MRRSNTKEFIQKAKLKHGDTYDYSFVVYVSAKTPLIINCPKHGRFHQLPINHLAGRGCKKCGDSNRTRPETRRPKTKWTTQTFVDCAREVHQNKYTYEKTVFIKASEKVIITCRDHGDWKQRPNDHLSGNGCPRCKFEKLADMKRSNVLTFVSEAILVHGPIYDYSKVQYKNAITKVKVGCGEHGEFKITPDKHLGGGGCPKCSNGVSRGEREIMKILDEHNIIYEREKRFPDLCGATPNSRLRYDFYLPNCNLLIEYDGEHHFMPVRTKGRFDKKTAAIKHEVTKKNDKKKNVYAKKNGYELLRIRYDQDIGKCLLDFIGTFE